MATTSATLDALDERRSARRPVHLTVKVQSDVEPGSNEARLADLSEHGCRVETSKPEVVGRLVTMTLPNQVGLKCWVAWTKRGEVGLDFANPLLPAAVDQIASAS